MQTVEEKIDFIKDFLTELAPWKEQMIRIMLEKKQAEEDYNARTRER